MGDLDLIVPIAIILLIGLSFGGGGTAPLEEEEWFQESGMSAPVHYKYRGEGGEWGEWPRRAPRQRKTTHDTEIRGRRDRLGTDPE